MRTWVSCKPQKTCLQVRTGGRLLRVERWQSTKAPLCRSSRDSREDREFYQTKIVKTHNNNLVVFAHVQLKSFYRLSTRDVTHVRKCTRPSPALPYCKRWEAGRGPGNKVTMKVEQNQKWNPYQTMFFPCFANTTHNCTFVVTTAA